MTETAAALAGLRVLVVEDEFFLAADLAAALVAAGAVVLGPVNSIAEAERLLADTRPDCAVLDMNLRGVSGGSVAERLMGERVPFLILSGYARDALPEGLGEAPYLEKPVDPGEVVRRLTALMSR